MNLRVSLCGTTMRWRFSGSAPWDEWAAARPWNGNGGAVVLAVPHTSSPLRFAEEVESSIRSVDQGRTSMYFQRPTGWASTALASVAHWLDLPVSSPFETKQHIANALADTPRLFIVEPLLPAALRSGIDDLIATVSKLAAGARLTCVLFAVDDEPSVSHLQFVEGEPAEPCLLPSATESVLFARYLHYRLAWESGGRLDVAEQLEDLLGDAQRLSDPDLETHLNSFSRTADASIAEGHIQRELLNQQKVRSRLTSRSRLPPWVARRMLLLGDTRLPSAFLRHRLSSMPLAREITARCFDIESECRSRLLPMKASTVSTEAGRQWADFQGGRGFARNLYPAGSPATPDSSWNFASFGEYLNAVGAKYNGPEHGIRVLRNALSHGHYVSWPAIEALLAAERQLARG